mgnify:FL=1
MVLRLCNELQRLKKEHHDLVNNFDDRTMQEQWEHLDKIDKVATEIQRVQKEVDLLLNRINYETIRPS